MQLAQRALSISEDCADAYVLLAEEAAEDLEEVRDLYQKGVEAGERAVGEEMFREDVGSFWGIFETRPYMRARQGLAFCLWELDEHQKAIDHYTDMLWLNPNDNQGIRYLLLQALLDEDADEALGELLDQYEDDVSAAWVYTRALWMFRKEGATEEANAALKEALQENPFVPLYLLGQRKLPIALPYLTGFGDESEAMMYVFEGLSGWLKTPGAMEWLRETADTVEMVVEPDGILWGINEDDEEFLDALEAEVEAAAELLRRALPELHGIEPLSTELSAASERLRAGFASGEWPYGHISRAAGWEKNGLPASDTELWFDAAGGLISPREDTGLSPEEESAIIAVELGHWLGAVIGLVHAGVGAPASPEALVSYINACPEIEGGVDPEDATLLERAFKLVLPAWEVDDRRRLTALGRWGLSRALAWAWGYDFDAEPG